MKLIIDVPENIMDTIEDDQMISREQLAVLQKHILDGIPYKKQSQGEWIIDNEHTKNPLLWYKCNLCGVYHSPTNFCPNCGAKMKQG